MSQSGGRKVIDYVNFWIPQSKEHWIQQNACEVKINLQQSHTLGLNTEEEQIGNYNRGLIITSLTENKLARPDFSLALLSHHY